MHCGEVLYFSVNSEARSLFKDYVEHFHFDKKCSFRLIDSECVFTHASDLFFLLDKKKSFRHLTVIIDYTSFGEETDFSYTTEELNSRDYDYNSSWRAADLIRRAILKYPEVLFIFDESGQESGNFADDFLFIASPSKNSVDIEIIEDNKYSSRFFLPYHQFNNNPNKEPFVSLQNGRDNLFDGSNLRSVIKDFLYGELKCARHNFGIIQNKRKENLALCVEEESAQNRFNSYALFANGFRVIPIVSAHELQYINECLDPNTNAQVNINPSQIIVVRDYDLQFADVKKQNNPVPIKRSNPALYDPKGTIINSISKINEIDRIRGMRFYENESQEAPGYGKRWLVLRSEETKPYWDNIIDDNLFLKKRRIPVYFISKGRKEFKIRSTSSPTFICDGQQEGCLQLKGMYKPITGIYLPFRNFKEIREVFDSIHNAISDKAQAEYIKKYPTGEPPIDDKSSEQVYKFITKRENHSHGIPLNLYDLVNSMLERAENYYCNSSYIKASMVANEAIEIMNGYHEALMLKAYRIKAISENAIAMSVSGGDEDRLRADTFLRINIILDEVHRMLFSCDSEEDRKTLEYNILNQIFSECRKFCKEKEHFKAEDCFISAMAHVTEGYTPRALWREFVSRIKSIKSSWSAKINE